MAVSYMKTGECGILKNKQRKYQKEERASTYQEIRKIRTKNWLMAKKKKIQVL